MQVQIHQREVDAQPLMFLGQTPVPHLVEAEHALQDAERVFYLGAHARINSVLLLL